MSTTPTETTSPAAPAAPVPAPPTPAPPAQATPTEAATPPAQETDWKAEARKWEQRAKDNTEKAQKFDALEEASKTEAQKQADALAAAQAKVKEYEQRDQLAEWAKEVSTETGVPANLLRGSSKEELAAHAEQLKALITAQATPPAPGTVPTIGNVPSVPNVSLADQIAEAEKAGNHRLAIALKRQLAAETKKTS